MTKSLWVKKARQQLGQEAIHIEGDGQFAFVTPCGVPAFSLWPTREEAENCANNLSTCGRGCRGRDNHYVYDLYDLGESI